jgi:hypothetical protein
MAELSKKQEAVRRISTPLNRSRPRAKKSLPILRPDCQKWAAKKWLFGYDTYPALGRWRICSKPNATAARQKNRGTKATLFTPMPVKLLDAGRANALKGKPIK